MQSQLFRRSWGELWACPGAALALGDNLSRILVERTRLRDQLDGLLDLRVFLEFHFEAVVQAKDAGENFTLYLPLEPGDVLLDFRLGVFDVLLAEVLAEMVEDNVVHHEILGDLRLFAEVEAREIADALRKRIENIATHKQLLKIIQFWRGDNVIGRNTALAKYLAAAVGELHFRGTRGLGTVVIIIERNILVIALD